MKCFYHSADLDGHCSGAIVKLKYPDCEMFGINYGDAFPWDKIEKGEKVFMVDFALQPFKPNMIKLFNKCELIWVDHHKSAIDEFEKIQLNEGLYIQGARCFDNSQAGCELTWEYLFDTDVPRAVKLLSEYDVWNHSDADTLPFQFGLRMYETHPNEQSLWMQLFGIDGLNPLDQIIGEGTIILSYQATENKKYCSACSFETELDGLKCIAINKMLTNSQIFDSVWNPEKYDAMLSFGYRKGSWTVSLYSNKPEIDVSKIAKARGGGGHKGAAGFQCDILPFKY
ncbi:MAG: hypothetical protein ABIC68_04600 [Candidatus Omnitrophota bacterium]